ncbi:MAG: anthranilate phosphoribosyltransferase [Rhodothermales bacterium]|nr:anthranilate phosphoribosyltransferase [Rhodothermales bacterium]
MRDYLALLSERRTLSEDQAADAMRLIMTGSFEPEEVAAFLLGLRARGETIDELAGFTRVMREFAIRVDPGDPNAIDLCGTGGDGISTFNISTTCAFVVAGAGVTVAKHGNRSVSSSCGSSDVLTMLGIETRLSKDGVEQCFRDAGMAFIFAPLFHPALGHVMPVRRKLGVRTFFNILGPICNPAFVQRQLIGCFKADVAEMMARILLRLESDHVRVVHSRDGLDEISTSHLTDSYGFSSRGTSIAHEVIDTQKLGLPRIDLSSIRSGSPEENRDILLSVLEGQAGPARDIVVANATYAIHVAGLYDSLSDCFEAANTSIDSGAARTALQRLREVSLEADRIA